MAYSELIKNFNKIRDYMRDFYVYGFKSRDDYTKKSARSYDDEKRRIESWLGNYMKFHQTVDGKNVDMPPKELELLYFLASSPNQVFTREQLLDQIWGYEYVGDTRTVDVHIKRLREKIKDHPSWGLSTVWGIGYKFEVK